MIEKQGINWMSVFEECSAECHLNKNQIAANIRQHLEHWHEMSIEVLYNLVKDHICSKSCLDGVCCAVINAIAEERKDRINDVYNALQETQNEGSTKSLAY